MMAINYRAIGEQISPEKLGQEIGAEKVGSSWRCPKASAHANGDRKPSLSIYRHDGRTCAKCHSCGLAGDAVKVAAQVWGVSNSEAARRLCDSLGLQSASEIVAEYIYRDAAEKPALKVIRRSDKSFVQATWTGTDWDFKAAKPKLPYRLPELLSQPERLVVVVEGEKDANNLTKLGFLATTNPGGAGKWRDEYSQTIAGRQVAVIPDNDKAGHRHALEVARSLMSVGCAIRIVALPGVAEKGDVSDWLVAGGTADQLRELIRQAPVLDAVALNKLASAWGIGIATNGAAKGESLDFTSWRDLLSEPDEATEWLVDGLLPAGGMSLLVSKPKTGKSTLARCLVVAVAEGKPWLGRAARQGPVLYIAPQEKRQECKEHFRSMGAPPESPFHVFISRVPVAALEKLRQEAEKKRPVLIVIDQIFKFSQVKDVNDYAQVQAAMEPLLYLAREIGAHVLTTHHAGKSQRDGGDEVLGSTALFGEVDTLLSMRRTENYRTIYSRNRYGTALRRLLNEEKVNRSGTGKRGDSFRYFISASLHPDIHGDAGMQKPNSDPTEGKEDTYSASQEITNSEKSFESRDAESEHGMLDL